MHQKSNPLWVIGVVKPKKLNHFFALRPAVSIEPDLLRLQAQCEATDRTKTVALADLHCTLVFLGPLQIHSEKSLCEMANEIKSEGFSLSLDRLDYWRKPKIACVSSAVTPVELLKLVELLRRGCDRLGFELQVREYRPHITLMRQMKPFQSSDLEKPVTWFVDSFFLFRSPRTGETGYQVLDYWKLDQ